MENNENSNLPDYDDSTYSIYNYIDGFYGPNYAQPIMFVITCIIISIGLPLTLLAIYSLYSQIKNDHVATIYIINLLISDLIQFCYMIVRLARPMDRKIYKIFPYIYLFGLLASVGFMVFIALDRYWVTAWPMWYRFRRTIKISLLVCVMVWILSFVYVLPVYFIFESVVLRTICAVFLLVPFPLFIFFLVGTLKALSAAISVPSDEKRQTVGMLVLVLLIYTLLFLPAIIWFLVGADRCNHTFISVMLMLLRFSPLADLILYIFIRKGAIEKFVACLCCCRMDSDNNSRSSP